MAPQYGASMGGLWMAAPIIARTGRGTMPQIMKLATQLSLLLVGAVLVALAAMGGFFAFNLERGFVAYINAQQGRQLDALVDTTQRFAERIGTLDPLLRDRRLWNRMLRDTEDGEAPPDVGMYFRPPPPMEGGGPEFRPGPPPPRPGDGPGLARRFVLLGPGRHPPPGEPLPPPGRQPPLERPIRVGDRIEGYILHFPYERVSRAEDLAFLRNQFAGVLAIAGILLLGAALAAPLIARRWARPLRDIGRATGRIAKGESGVKVEAGGAREIEALAGDVNAMAASLAELDASRRRWIAQSAHELRTPLMVLRGEIDGLQDGVRTLDAKALASLSDEVRRLTKLVDDLHLVSVADLKGLPTRLERMDLAPVVRRAVERFGERAASKGLTLSLDAPDKALVIDGDEDRLAQLMDNLLENSLRYTDAPGRVQVVLAHAGSVVRLTVQDTKPGPAREECARIFEPLHKVDGARSRKAGGSGLGLAICRAIAKAHGAAIAAEPSALGGLAVTVAFEAAR